MDERILVALDGGPGSLGALWTANLLAIRDGYRVDVVVVHEPTELYGYGATGTTAGYPPGYAAEVGAEMRSRVEAQLASVGVEQGERWSLHMASGQVSAAIPRIAAEVGAQAIVMGLHSHAARGRVVARETVLRIAQLASAPVIAAPADAVTLPRRALVAIDASEFSLRAAEQAAALLDADADLHLAQVLWHPSAARRTPAADWTNAHYEEIERQLNELARSLSERAPVRTTTHVLSGEPSRALLDLADEIGADLIAAGSHGLGFLGRLFLGSVSSKLVRGARCMVLIAPPAARDAGLLDRLEARAGTGTTEASEEPSPHRFDQHPSSTPPGSASVPSAPHAQVGASPALEPVAASPERRVGLSARSSPVICDLDRADCEALLARNYVGRLAYARQHHVDIEPVHYVYSDGWIYGRTSEGAKLRMTGGGWWPVAFEVDEVTNLFQWKSVVVHGGFYTLSPDAAGRQAEQWQRAVELLRSLIADTFTDQDPVPFRDVVFRIAVQDVRGRVAGPALQAGRTAGEAAGSDAIHSLRPVPVLSDL
jgi:uncharacterized protein